MLRHIAATLAGIVTAVLLILLVEFAGHQIWPPPAGMDLNDSASIAAAMAQMPFGALATVALAWIIEAFGGAWVAGRLSGKRVPSFVVGGVVVLSSVANLLMIPHPWWFWIAALALVPVASALAAGLSVRERGDPVAARVTRG